jgi:periplasmic protein CpxP/Spy
MNTDHFNAPGRALRLLAVTALIGLAGAVVQTAHAAPGGMAAHGDVAAMGERGKGMGMGMDGPGHMGHMGHMGRLLDRVGASAEQKAQIKTIMDAARNELKPVHAQMKTLREQSAALFTQPAVDANAAEAARLQMQTLHNQVSKRMLQAMVESSRVLTPEQRAKMADFMKKRRAMAERHRAEAESLMGTQAGAK